VSKEMTLDVIDEIIDKVRKSPMVPGTLWRGKSGLHFYDGKEIVVGDDETVWSLYEDWGSRSGRYKK